MSDEEENAASSGTEYSPNFLFIQYSELFERSFSAETADECISAAVRCLTLAKISYSHSNVILRAQWHCMLARAYWLLKGLGPQTYDHAKSALQVLTEPAPTKSKQTDDIASQDWKLHLQTTLESLMLAAKALRSMGKSCEAKQYIKKALHIFKQNKSRMNDDEQTQWTLQLYDELSYNEYDLERINDACVHLEVVIQVVENTGESESSILIPLYLRMARLLEKMSQKQKAIEYYKRAHNAAFSKPIVDITTADASIVVIKQLIHRAEGLIDDKKLKEYLESAAAVYARDLGENDPKTIEVQCILNGLKCEHSDQSDSDR
ncbi:hypothetical protein M514_03580 [Trichuris suis]|uniref:Tetratricopeptide repeat protein n=1 Tax=Trichuris suis TaxID=68888 RepID=A0A085NPD4_9BILA|nr:hypothetical protein M513_03580 [Trichuris suis]KFD71330.1 hypothetical protein M514_03580 [Trichuris suis]KHJ48362.1 tetratricopeptide repeat protein [Trichuris suis]